MSPIEVMYTVGLTLAGSIAIAYTTLWLQRRIRRRRLYNALHREVGLNLSVAKRDLELINFFERREGKGDWTYFDISPLYTAVYQDFRLSGETINLSEEIRTTLEKVYELIYIHNRQASFMSSEFPPRTGGMAKRLELIIESLNSLHLEMKRSKQFR